VTAYEIKRCEGDGDGVLQMLKPSIPLPKARQKGARYTPVSKRGDRPNAIAWLLKNYPELPDSQISRLIGTTKPTIAAVRDRSHWNATNIKPENPVGLGICSAIDLEKAVAVSRARSKTVHAPKAEPAQPSTEPTVSLPPMGSSGGE